MPTIKVIGSYGIEIHTGRERNLPHVHVVHDGRDVLVNLLTLETYGETRFRLPKVIQEYLRHNQTQLLKKWDEYHGRRD
jgi:hypothetical protein